MSGSISSADDTRYFPDSGDLTISRVEPEIVVTEITERDCECDITYILTVQCRLKGIRPVNAFRDNGVHVENLNDIICRELALQVSSLDHGKYVPGTINGEEDRKL